MGMDYRYAGSASYPRFNDEIKGIVELFGGRMTTNRKPQEECNMIEYFMEKPLEYEMPEGTPKIIVKWVNEPFEDYSSKEVREIYKFLEPKWDKVEEISDQIAYELQTLVEYFEGWSIS